ncbi:MAG: lysophospholipid acyltransferase family protein [bacterium]|nr:lysophospholipid acyltransferase family protein [bacterium]
MEELESSSPIISVFWHRTSFLLLANFRNSKNIAIFTSLIPLGEYLTALAQKLGYKVIRTSPEFGNPRGFREMIELMKNGYNAAIAVDGPRGPALKVKPGAIYLAKKTGYKILPIGVAVKRKRVFKRRWDRYILPYPFNKGLVIFGKSITVPNDTNDINNICQELERLLNQLTLLAESLI